MNLIDNLIVKPNTKICLNDWDSTYLGRIDKEEKLSNAKRKPNESDVYSAIQVFCK